nr:hypothetical protein [Chitinophagaceae bacterium]
KTENLERIENTNTYEPPNGLVLNLSHKEIYLGYFEFIQARINNLISGDKLTITDEGCKNAKGELILKFSRKFIERLMEIKKTGFVLSEAKVNFIVYWKAEDKEQEVKIVLPELIFERKIVHK